MGVLHRESGQYRLPPGFVLKGYGKRLTNAKTKHEFDVLSPMCQAMIAGMWEETAADYELDRAKDTGILEASDALASFEATRLHPLDTILQIRWLLDHFPALTFTAVAEVLEVDLAFVSRQAKVRARQRSAARERKGAVLPKGNRLQSDVAEEGPACGLPM